MTIDESLLSEVAEIDERRRDERSRIILNLYYDGHDATGVASLRDISLGGLYMNTNEEFTVGTILHLRIPINEQENVVAKAEVVYVNSGAGVGVKFIALSDNTRELLEKKLTG